MDIHELAEAVRNRRLENGWSVEEAARRAGINRVTYKRIETGLSVHDVKRRAVEALFGLDGTSATVTAREGASAVPLIGRELNPDLADFSDHEILAEIEARMLLLAARAQASGGQLLRVTVDPDGERRIVSHTRNGD